MWYIYGPLGLILGLFVGFLAASWVYRKFISQVALSYVKKREQEISVGKRYTNQAGQIMIEDMLDHAVTVAGFGIPIGTYLKEKSPDTFSFFTRLAKKNPDAFWYTVGHTVLPMVMGLHAAQVGKGKEKQMIQQVESVLSPDTLINPQSILGHIGVPNGKANVPNAEVLRAPTQAEGAKNGETEAAPVLQAFK